ncbi:MAG: RnfABCDGE type electron transport complex subunit G [Clostridia bacterium]|nr:RnfABCDGE type electron transport complex subunit G [Clostridia bacterium]
MAKSAENKLEMKEILRIGGILCIICAAVALILSFVNMVTAAKIAENEELEKKSAIVALFGSQTVEYTTMEGTPETVNSIYSVTDKGSDLGYCVSVSPGGFGGDVNLMVGVNSDGSVIGVRVVSHSETPGLGSRIEADSFLSQFVGKSGSVAEGQDYDIISGSTVSSDAVAAGVNTALDALSNMLTGGVTN